MELDSDQKPRAGIVTCVLVIEDGHLKTKPSVAYFARPSEGVKEAIQSLRANPANVRAAITTVEDGELPTVMAKLSEMADFAPQGSAVVSLGTLELARPSLPSDCRFDLMGNFEVGGQIERLFVLKVTPTVEGDGPARAFHDLFLGRNAELTALRRRLELARTVCLYGPPGVGKTALVRRFVAEHGDDQDAFLQTYELDLAGVSQPEVVLPMLRRQINALRLPGESLLDSIAASLREARVLLVIDHAEGVLSEVAMVVERLTNDAPNVGVILCSQRPPTLYRAARMQLLGLETPNPDEDPRVSATCDSVRLFVDRASLLDDQFIPNHTDYVAIAEICRRLDGNPLAIEMAAARVKVHRPKAILDRLNLKFSLLKDENPRRPYRHQSLEAAVTSGYDLLRPEAKTLLHRLSLLQGSFSAAEAVEYAADTRNLRAEAVEGAFVDLAELSFLTVSPLPSSTKRFVLSETIRDFAQERLRKAGEDLKWQRRYRDFCLSLFDRAEQGLHGSEQPYWIERIEAAYDDLRESVLHTAKIDRNVDLAMHCLVTVLSQYHLHRAFYCDGIILVNQISQLPQAEHAELFPRVLNYACALANQMEDFHQARPYGVRSARIARKRGNVWVEAAARSNLAFIAQRTGKLKRAYRHGQFAAHAYEKMNREEQLAQLLVNSHPVAYQVAPETLPALERRVEHLLAKVDNPVLRAIWDLNLTDSSLSESNFRKAAAHGTTAFAYFSKARSNRNLPIALRNLSFALLGANHLGLSAEFFRAAEFFHRHPEVRLRPEERTRWLEHGVNLRARLGPSFDPGLEVANEPDMDYLLLNLQKASF